MVRPRDARRPRPARLPEDLGLARDPRQRAGRAEVDVHRGPPRGAGAGARGRAADRAGDLEVVEGGAPRRLRRLQPERPRPHRRLGLVGAPGPRRPRLDPARVGRGARRRPGRAAPRHRPGAARRARRPLGDDRRRPPLARLAARARRPRRGRGPRRRPVAAPLPQAEGRAEARAAEPGAEIGTERRWRSARPTAADWDRDLAVLPRDRRRRRDLRLRPRASPRRSREAMLDGQTPPGRDVVAVEARAVVGSRERVRQPSRAPGRTSPSASFMVDPRHAARGVRSRRSASGCSSGPDDAGLPRDAVQRGGRDQRARGRALALARLRRRSARFRRQFRLPDGRARRAARDAPQPRTQAAHESSWSSRHSARRLVVAPAQDLRPVADAPGRDVVEADLDHELGPQRDPLEVAVGRPAARVGRAALAGLVRGQRLDQLALLLRLQARGVADDVQLAVARRRGRASASRRCSPPCPGASRRPRRRSSAGA